MPAPLHEPVANAVVFAPEVAVAGDRKDVEPVAEKVGQDEAEPHRVRRDADEDEDGRRPV
jgi:hypothetical protein